MDSPCGESGGSGTRVLLDYRLSKLGIDKFYVPLFDSRSKKRGQIIAIQFFSILIIIILAIIFGIWGIINFFS